MVVGGKTAESIRMHRDRLSAWSIILSKHSELNSNIRSHAVMVNDYPRLILFSDNFLFTQRANVPEAIFCFQNFVSLILRCLSVYI